jgi:hypothetical protein
VVRPRAASARFGLIALFALVSLVPTVFAQPLDEGEAPAAGSATGSGSAAAKPSPASPGIAFLGLRPLTKKGGTEDIIKLKDAQQVRATLESELAQASKQPVLGHSQMSSRLGASYLVAMFKCSGQVSCLTKLVAPLKKEGFTTVMVGDYYVEGGSYHVHIVRISLETGAVEKEVNFTISQGDVADPSKWTANLAPFVKAQVGKLVVTINEPDAICRVDGDPCKFESDNKTIVLPGGDHELVISKDGFESKKEAVTIDLGATKQVAISLSPKAAGEGELRVPSSIGRRAPSLPVVRVESPPKIDGQLDDPVWEKGWVDPNFTQNFPDEGKAPSEQTEVRVLYDNEAIYIGVRAFDSEPNKIVARLTRRDRDIDSDKVTVDISSKNDRASAYHFQVSAAGVQVDGIRFGDTEYDNAWDGRWYSETSTDAKGWTAELKIPLSTLRYNGDVTAFGFQVRRNIARKGEIDEWSYVPRTAKGEVSYYGVINGMSGLNAKRLFDVLVYDSRRFTFRRNQTFNGRTDDSDIGADIKVGLTPALTLNGTINPDFGTVEVDQVVLNLSTVETYFPEKRPFFLEGAELFTTPFSLFYTRRIGARPPTPSLTGDAAALEPAKDGRIWGAMNMSGLLSKRTSIALLDAVTARQDVDIERMAGGPRESLLVDPLTNFGVLRLRNEFGNNNSIGLLATSVNRIEEKGAAAPQMGDLCPTPYSTEFASLVPPTPNKGRCTNDAYTGGVDMAVRSASGEYAVKGQVVGSLIEHGPKRFIPDGTFVGSGSKGFATIIDAGRYGGDTNWLYRVHFRNASPKLQINDAGYLGYANFHEASAAVTWRTKKPTGPFLSFRVDGSMAHRRDWKLMDNTNFGPDLSATVQLKNFWTINLGGEPYFIKWVENRETQDGARTQRNSGWYSYGSLATNPNKALVLSTAFVWWGTYGELTSLNGEVQLSLKPIPALELDLLSSFLLYNNNPRSVYTIDNGDGTRTYVFNELDYKQLDITMRGTYTFTRTLSLQAYLQTFLASGDLNHPSESTASGDKPLLTRESFSRSSMPAVGGFRDGALNVNLFLRWEYLPLSALWFVYTHTQAQTPFDQMMEGNAKLRFDRFSGGSATDVLLLKLTYLWY